MNTAVANSSSALFIGSRPHGTTAIDAMNASQSTFTPMSRASLPYFS